MKCSLPEHCCHLLFVCWCYTIIKSEQPLGLQSLLFGSLECGASRFIRAESLQILYARPQTKGFARHFAFCSTLTTEPPTEINHFLVKNTSPGFLTYFPYHRGVTWQAKKKVLFSFWMQVSREEFMACSSYHASCILMHTDDILWWAQKQSTVYC